MEKIAVIGAGSWGTAISTLLAEKGFSVSLWARDGDLVEAMQSLRRNPRYLPELLLPKNLYITGDLSEVLSKAEMVALAVPSHAMRSIIRMLKDELKSNVLIVSLTKGIEVDTLMRMSEVIQGELSSTFQVNIGVLSGPNHAEEVAQKIPTATVVSAFDKGLALKLQEVFMTPYFRVYTNPDVVGVELGGATKNVIAIAAGISDGLGYGDNTKASLMTRGLAEMTRLGVTLGARPLTFAGLSGVGDLIATCTSRHSRNRAVGEKLGRGMSLSQILQETTMVAEGIRTAKAVYQLAQKYEVDMPITKSVAEVIYFGKDPHDCVVELMSRGPTEEIKEGGI
ncbi:MAG: NAD(P)H-dependent glycerol-3-phosphate dehydrogenase [Actinomycetota bacterium]